MEIELIMEEREAPRTDCGFCGGSGKITCPDCGGVGRVECQQCHGDGKAWGGVGGECLCHYNESALAALLCSCVKGKVPCSCVRAKRYAWTDVRHALGNEERIEVMAELDKSDQWKFFMRENSSAPWRDLLNTEETSARLAQVIELTLHRNRQTREKLHALLDNVPDHRLIEALNYLKALGISR